MFASWRKYFKSENQDLSLLILFKPVYIALVIVGLFPYCLKFKSNHCVIIPRTIYLNCLCAVSITLLMTVFGCINILGLIKDISTISYAMTQVNYVIEVILLLATCVSAYISVYSYRYKIVYLLNRMASTWVELPITKNNILENLRYQIVFSSICLLTIQIVYVIINFTRNDGKEILVTMSFILPQMVQFAALGFYYVLILMLSALLRNIEAVIKTLRDKGCVPRGIPVAVANMRSMELLYVKTQEIKEEINDTFQATLLLACMQGFHAIVSEAHIIYHGLLVTQTLTTHNIVNFSVWIFYQLMKVYALAHSGNLLNIAVSIYLSNILASFYKVSRFETICDMLCVP